MASLVVMRAIRRSLHRQRVFKDQRCSLEMMDDDQLYTFFCFGHAELSAVCEEVTENVVAPRHGALSPIMQVHRFSSFGLDWLCM